jgi:Fic family protein
MQVVSGPISRDRIRRKHIHFEAPAAERLPQEVAAFLKWFEGRESMDPVLRAGVAHLWFVTLHPFEDGNGRVSRAIADMALARAEGSTARFYSMSTPIEADKKAYYLILEKTQKGGMDITDWQQWFLGCMDRALKGAETSLAGVLRKSATWERINDHFQVNDRQRTVVNQMLDGPETQLSTSRYAKLADCSLDTALRDINDLVGAGILLRGASGGRSTKYSLAARRT